MIGLKTVKGPTKPYIYRAPYISDWECVKFLTIRFLGRRIHFLRVRYEMFAGVTVGVKKRSKEICSRSRNKLRSHTIVVRRYLVQLGNDTIRYV